MMFFSMKFLKFYTRFTTEKFFLRILRENTAIVCVVLVQNMSSKNFSVGETVWALWPGSKRYYEAKVLDVRKSAIYVDFKDGFKTEVPLRQVYVRKYFVNVWIILLLRRFYDN